MPIELDLSLRVLVAAVVGGIIGAEREVNGHEAGVRTHALVALGAALFTVAGAYGFDGPTPGADPARVAAQVAAGVGFIGAGAVLRHGPSVRGLTTAATLWVTAAIGVASGAGLYWPLLAAAAASLLILVVLRFVKPTVLDHLGERPVTVLLEYERGHGTLGPALRRLAELRCKVVDLRLEDDDGEVEVNGLRRVALVVRTNDMLRLDQFLEEMRSRAEVTRVTRAG